MSDLFCMRRPTLLGICSLGKPESKTASFYLVLGDRSAKIQVVGLSSKSIDKLCNREFLASGTHFDSKKSPGPGTVKEERRGPVASIT